ncbi:MAG: saccharopine dehydrogenase NADP-binding domain-containing protein [Dehalococcoidia bacterium]|nr:saccharopine dehydrogenase NADP-binding domain-containing protein [Dehalococcoidia bacterium]
MRVLVLGGAGRMAYAIIKDLLEIDTDEVSKVIIADINCEKVKNVADEFQNEKLIPACIDIAEYAKLVNLMKGSDVVIDSTYVSSTTSLSIIKAALEARVHVINLGQLDKEEEKQAATMSDAFTKAGLSGVLGLGSSPGISNLMVRELADRLDTMSTVEISFAYESIGTSTLPIKEPFAFEEFVESPLIFQDAKFVTVPPQSGIQYIEFPAPIGMRPAFCIPHSEVWTVAETFEEKGVKNVSVRAGFTPDFVKKVNFLVDCGLMSHKPLKVGDIDVIPSDVLFSCLVQLPPEQGEVVDYGCTRVVAVGTKNKEKVEYTALMLNRPYKGLTNAQHRTGHSPSIAARMLYRGEIKTKGVFPPERGVDPKPFFRELAKRELEIAVTSSAFVC